MKKHITVCICTYKRSALLSKLLEYLDKQRTDNLFNISISIVDNDLKLSAKPVVHDFVGQSRLEITYTNVPERNLALVRNASLDNAKGDYIAFIDDDEFPAEDWLLLLYKTLNKYNASGAFGPVLPCFQITPPLWVVKGQLCERERLQTGSVLDWWHTRTGNALLKRSIFDDPKNRFDLKFRVGGEDDTLFKHLISQNHKFVWCDEAVVYEEVPYNRLSVAYFIKRSQLIGYINYRYLRDERSNGQNLLFVFKSILACLLYLILLPPCLIRGYHYFVKMLIRFYYHKGVIMTFLGVLQYDNRDI